MSLLDKFRIAVSVACFVLMLIAFYSSFMTDDVYLEVTYKIEALVWAIFGMVVTLNG